MKPKDERYTVAVDFDGVIHSYTTPWVEAWIIPDPPVPGAIEWLNEVQKKLDVVIFSTRCKSIAGAEAVALYLAENGFEGKITTSYEKPPALMYIDDRAYRFEGPGTFPTVEQIHQARPWYKK